MVLAFDPNLQNLAMELPAPRTTPSPWELVLQPTSNFVSINITANITLAMLISVYRSRCQKYDPLHCGQLCHMALDGDSIRCMPCDQPCKAREGAMCMTGCREDMPYASNVSDPTTHPIHTLTVAGLIWDTVRQCRHSYSHPCGPLCFRSDFGCHGCEEICTDPETQHECERLCGKEMYKWNDFMGRVARIPYECPLCNETDPPLVPYSAHDVILPDGSRWTDGKSTGGKTQGENNAGGLIEDDADEISVRYRDEFIVLFTVAFLFAAMLLVVTVREALKLLKEMKRWRHFQSETQEMEENMEMSGRGGNNGSGDEGQGGNADGEPQPGEDAPARDPVGGGAPVGDPAGGGAPAGEPSTGEENVPIPFADETLDDSDSFEEGTTDRDKLMPRSRPSSRQSGKSRSRTSSHQSDQSRKSKHSGSPHSSHHDTSKDEPIPE